MFGLAALVVLAAQPHAGRAQGLGDQRSTLPLLDQSILERLGRSSFGPMTPAQPVLSPVDSVLPERRFEDGFRVEIPEEAPSRLELDYKERLVLRAPEFAAEAPVQFGYRLVNRSERSDATGTGGAINGSYVLGIGDELIVTFRGQVNNSYRTLVDREGQVVLPDMPPVPAAGLTFEQFRAELERRTRNIFAQADVFASLGRVRNFPVLVVGQVNRPGMHRVTGIASILDAIISADGIQRSGSLRSVQLVRKGRIIRIDLYDLLLTGQLSEEIALAEGDRVFVPPVGDTFGVIGDVLRPGIYEFGRTARSISADRAMALSGGTLRPSGYRYLVVSTQPGGGDTVREATELSAESIGPGDILLVSEKAYGWTGAYFLDGHVAVPGPRSLNRDATIGGAINAPGIFREDPYTLFAVLQRTDPRTQARHFMAVDLERIRSGQGDARLRANDRLIVFSADDVRFLSSERVQAVLEGRAARATSILNPMALPAADASASGLSGRRAMAQADPIGAEADRLANAGTGMEPLAEPAPCSSLSGLAAVVSRSRSERFADAKLSINPEKSDAVPVAAECPRIFDRYPGLLAFVLDYAVSITGEVRRPGIYPVSGRTSLASLVPVVGGLALDADLTQIEKTSFDGRGGGDAAPPIHARINARTASLVDVSVDPGDIVRFNPKFSQRDVGSVFLAGEVKRPGVYSIRRGEKLSDAIARAGGLTDQAYPLGAVFTRLRVREQEAKAFERAAIDLQSGLAEALASRAGAQQMADPEALVLSVRELADALRRTEPVGRVVVEADPAVLQVSPGLDTVLEPGDRLIIPKRPNHVTVSGEVLNAGAIQFRAGKTVDEYIDAAGGVSRVADDGRTFVVFPNGEAKPVAVSSWNFTTVHIPPGSTIIVPRDPKPFDTMAFTISIADILSKLAITAASIAVIGNN